MLEKMRLAPLAAESHQPMHATYARTHYAHCFSKIPLPFSFYLYEQLSIPTLKMGPEGTSTTLVPMYEIKCYDIPE
jgi:hypothetical protein